MSKPIDTSKPLEVTLKVFIEKDASEKHGYRLLHVKVGDNPPVPIVKDKPLSRRLTQDLVRAATGQDPVPSNVDEETPSSEA